MTTSQSYQKKIADRTSSLVLNGVRCNVREWGQRGDRQLFALHGWGDCSASFQFLVDALGMGWHIVALDWRGFGESDWRGPSYWFPDYVADLHRLLAEFSPDGPAAILGHSMGANVVGLYAGIYPERVSALINVEGFGLQDSDPHQAPQNYRRWVDGLATPAGYSEYADFAALADRIGKRSPGLDPLQALFVARHWGQENAAGKVALRADPAHKLPNAVQYRRQEAEACWRAVTARVLLVSGAQSDFVPQLMAWLGTGVESLPFDRAETVSIANAGHMIHHDNPRALAEAVADFL